MAQSQEDRIKKILVHYGGDLMVKAKPWSESRTFADLPPYFAVTIKTHPGSGKSRDATEFVNDAWENGDYKGLYLMLSHEAIQERLKWVKDKDWSYWRGHDDGCERGRNADAGYLGVGQCLCERGERKAERPTIAPLDYILPGLPGDGRPLIEAACEFDFWVIDEMDFRRLLGYMAVNVGDVERVARTHPDGGVRAMSEALLKLMEGLSHGERLNGNELYTSLIAMLESDLPDVRVTPTLTNACLPRHSWLDSDEDSLPANFPPTLVPVLLEEVRDWCQGTEFNPRIHLVREADGPQLRVWWRKDMPSYNPEWNPPPFFILDATADDELLEKVFNVYNVEPEEPQEWPPSVYVHQWPDNMVTRQTLNIRKDGGTFAVSSVKNRQRWYGRIADALKDFPRDWPVGIITHKAIEEDTNGAEGEAKRQLRTMGFTDVRSRHYGDERGSNVMEDVKILVLLGLPIPPPDEFKEEAQAFLHDAGPLDFTWEQKELYLDMREKPPLPVKIGGYWSEPVSNYYYQKCRAGLYQALHRIRPYIERNYERHIFIYTNMPIEDVEVSDLLRDAKVQLIVDRFDRAVASLTEALEATGECTVPQLAGLITLEGEGQGSIRRWIGQNGIRLAEATESEFNPGKGKRPGRFVRQG